MNRFNYFLKRSLDIFLVILTIVLGWWLYLLTALIIKITSPGPVFYKAKRMGKNGKEFVLYKFRSMRVDSGRVRVITLNSDDRVFPFGRFIRKTKIDELPQLFNIIKGDMSIVGPRPEDVGVAQSYFDGEYEKIYKVLPGLTSAASLYDYTHGELYESQEEYIKNFMPVKLEMEVYYANNSSFFYDIAIIFKTAYVIILKTFGKRNFNVPKELKIVKQMIEKKEKKKELV